MASLEKKENRVSTETTVTRNNKMLIRYDDKSVAVVKCLLGIGLLCSSKFSRKQKENARIAGDKASELLWATDEGLDLSFGTGLTISGIIDLVLN